VINDELESELCRVRQALAGAVAVEIQIKQQMQKNSEAAAAWQKRAELARAQALEDMAAQAEAKVKECISRANELQMQLLAQQDQIAAQKKDLSKLESRRFSTGSTGASALAASEANLSTMQRMENKIAAHESMAELGNEDVERKFAADKVKDDLEDELAALKAAMKKEP
jgi:phage shock protein A